MPTDPEARARALVDDHGDLLRAVAADVHEARAAFLGEGFDGYVADTVYVRELETYHYWPRKAADGRYLGFDEPTPGERTPLDRAAEAGFDHLDTGISRVVVGVPAPRSDLVVKLGRAGTGPRFGRGRTHNLRERQYTTAYGDAAPLAPTHHVDPDGAFAVAERVEGPTLAERPDETALADLRRRLRATVPPLAEDGPPLEPQNAAWRGEDAVAVDYASHGACAVVGLPTHVDAERVIAGVDERRRRGEKRDLVPGSGWVEPAVGDE